MSHKRITVLRGGPSEEYEVSLKTGANVLRSLSGQYQSVNDVIIAKNGDWLSGGVVRRPEHILTGTDVVFLALHGQYGEDGQVQNLIQKHNIPFTGSRSLPSAIAFNKKFTKRTLKDRGILMPNDFLVTEDDLPYLELLVTEITSRFGPDYVVKPVSSGSSFGVEIVHGEDELEEALFRSLPRFKDILVEEYIMGREATCATLENFRNEEIYTFPIIEIIPPVTSKFFSSDVKYTGETQEICPGNFTYAERTKLAEIAALVHKELGLEQYSRSDFIVRNGEVYFLEVNTLPGLTSESLFPKAAAAVGLTYKELIAHLIETAKS